MKKLSDILNEALVKQHATRDTDKGPTFIDLDLPSGILWCDRNVGAKSIYDGGYFVSWADDNLNKENVRKVSYKFYNPKYDTEPKKYYLKYNEIDKIKKLNQEDDICKTVQKNAYTPSVTEFRELVNNTNTKVININGITGIEFTSLKNEKNKIFIPFAGVRTTPNVTEINENAELWLSDLLVKDNNVNNYKSAYTAFIDKKTIDVWTESRRYAFNVRAVCKNK